MVHATNGSGSFRSLTRYEEYYLSGGDLFFLVEHHVFRVHRYFFERESGYFRGKLATPASPGATRQGTSETNAIVLDDVKVTEFARFLWVFYNPKYSLYHTSAEDWVAILTLAQRWSFPEVKALAVRELERQHLPDIDRVVVYQDNEVDRSLLIVPYAALCERDEPLTPAEGRLLGFETALTIARLREMARRSPIDCRSPAPSNFHGSDLVSLVRELFGIVGPLEDDKIPETPLGGPPPPLWLPSPAKAPPPPPQKPTAQPPMAQPQFTRLAQTAMPPQRTGTPPPSIAQVQQLLTQPQPPSSPKPERPQVQTSLTGRKGLLNNKTAKTADQSRPSTPAPETPVGEKPKKVKKVTTKKQQEETPSVSSAAKAEEKTDVTSAAPVPEETQRQDEAAASGAGADVEKVGDNVGSSQEGAEAGSTVPVSDVVFPSVGSEVKADGVKGDSVADGVSTDGAGTAGPTSDTQVDLLKNDSIHSRKPSLQDRLKGAAINNSDLMSPSEKSSPSSRFSLW